jgi:hypothetical protein
MTQAAQRLGLLAAIALVASLVALVVVRELGGDSSSRTPRIQAEPAPGGNWTVVRAGITKLTEKGKKTACGVAIGPKTFGVAHPSLPCGARIFVAYEHTQVLTQVVERGPYVPGREFELTPALAAKLGIDEETDVRWCFAR